MAKFCGTIGFLETKETSPGVWSEEIVEYPYVGDIIKRNMRWENGESLNDNITISNSISIISDNHCQENIGFMRYVRWMGSCWKITDIEINSPRLILRIGGVYNEPGIETGTSPDTD